MHCLGQNRLAVYLLAALGAGLVSCGGNTTAGIASSRDASADSSADSSTGGSGTGGWGGTGATAGTGATTGTGATGGTGASGGSAGAPTDPCAGVTCNPPAVCLAGSCRCASGEEYCGGTCVDTQTDRSNCGACGHACQSGWDCTSGQCQPPGSCSPAFCPSPGYGTPCCVTSNGPCGVDYGVGCVQRPADAGP